MSYTCSCNGEFSCGEDFDLGCRKCGFYSESIREASGGGTVGGTAVERSTIRVLVVDDYEPWRHFMLSMLHELPGFEVVSEVSDGLEAVRKVQEFEVDLILLDIGLPTLNGIAAAKEIRRLAPQSKILFVSQESSPDVVREALKTGEGYLVKADAARELRTAVNTVLRSKRFVGSRFVGQGFPEASDGPTQRVENKNVFASLEQTKRVGHRHKVIRRSTFLGS